VRVSAQGSTGPWLFAGCLVIAIALYLALHRPDGAPVPSATGNAAIVSAGAAPVAPSPVVPATAAPTPEAAARVREEVARAIAGEREAWLKECWEPAVARSAEPGTSLHHVQVSVDGSGREVLRAIGDVRGETRDEVAQCLRAHYRPMRVTPPGAPTAVDVTVRFP
jgi:hypothetical protein